MDSTSRGEVVLARHMSSRLELKVGLKPEIINAEGDHSPCCVSMVGHCIIRPLSCGGGWGEQRRQKSLVGGLKVTGPAIG